MRWDRKRRSPICLLVRPAAASIATSYSCEVSGISRRRFPWFPGVPRTSPAARSSFSARSLPGTGTQSPEDVERGAELLARLRGSPGPAQPLAVGELDPGQVERPVCGPGDGQCLREQGHGLVVRGGDSRRTGHDQGQPRRDAGQADLAHHRDVGSRLRVAAGANRGLHEVEGDPERMRDVRGEDPGRADRGGLLVSALEIALSHRGQRPGVARIGLHRPAAARPGPAGYLVGELFGRVVVAAGGGQQRLAVLSSQASSR